MCARGQLHGLRKRKDLVMNRFKVAPVQLIVFAGLLVLAAHAGAADTRVLDDVTARYQSAASAWAGAITGAATRLFWTLAVISMVWTFGMMALRKADIGEFFAEFARFTIFTGFYWWILSNGPQFATSIMDSLKQLGGQAGGVAGVTPSGIVDVGFNVFGTVLDKSSLWSPVESTAGILMGILVLGMLALVAVNMVLLLISGWILAYAGVFFLGFGGAKWTSDMAINYYKTVLGVAASLLGMVLLAGVGKAFIDDYYAKLGNASLKDMSVLLVASLVLLVLVNKVPGLIAGIITGASVGGAAGAGSLGAGALLGAGAVAGAAAATGGAALAAGSANAAGAWGAAKAAFTAAQTGSGPSTGGGGMLEASAGGSGGGGSLADAMGGSSGGGSGAGTPAFAGDSLSAANDGGAEGKSDSSKDEGSGSGEQPQEPSTSDGIREEPTDAIQDATAGGEAGEGALIQAASFQSHAEGGSGAAVGVDPQTVGGPKSGRPASGDSPSGPGGESSPAGGGSKANESAPSPAPPPQGAAATPNAGSTSGAQSGGGSADSPSDRASAPPAAPSDQSAGGTAATAKKEQSALGAKAKAVAGAASAVGGGLKRMAASSFGERVDKSFMGRLASEISNPSKTQASPSTGQAPSVAVNTSQTSSEQAGSTGVVDAASEVAAFRDRKAG